MKDINLSAYHLLISHALYQGAAWEFILQALLQATQFPFEPRYRAAIAFPAAIRRGAPVYGGYSREVIAELGYTAAEIEAMICERAVIAAD